MVLSVVNNSVYLNSDMIPRQQQVFIQQPGQPVYAQVPGQPMYAQPGQPMYVQPGQPMYANQPIMPMNQSQVYPAPQYVPVAQAGVPQAQVVGAAPAGYAPVQYEPLTVNK